MAVDFYVNEGWFFSLSMEFVLFFIIVILRFLALQNFLLSVF